MALISNKIIEKLQYRIQQEELSSRLYKSMSIWLNLNGYENASKVWCEYANEEMEHAQWVYDYLLELNIKPEVQNLEAVESNFKDFPQIIAKSYMHEKEVTDQCKELAKLCAEENDFMTMNVAQKFLAEQADEMSKVQLHVDKLKTFGTSKEALKLFDMDLGKYLG